ncbi:MAG: hypothetical protein U0U66_01125 [Cytophagaceae bacterium]
MKYYLNVVVFFSAFFCISINLVQAQTPVKEGGNPVIELLIVSGDSLKPLVRINHGTEYKIKVVLKGGIEKTRHQLNISSTQALITKSEEINVYYVIPLSEGSMGISVEIELREPYQVIKLNTQKKKVTKEIVKVYPPKNYLIGYQVIQVD